MIQASYRSNTLQRKGSEEMYPRGPAENVFSTSEHSTALHRVTITGERIYYRVRSVAAQSLWVISGTSMLGIRPIARIHAAICEPSVLLVAAFMVLSTNVFPCRGLHWRGAG